MVNNRIKCSQAPDHTYKLPCYKSTGQRKLIKPTPAELKTTEQQPENPLKCSFKQKTDDSHQLIKPCLGRHGQHTVISAARAQEAAAEPHHKTPDGKAVFPICPPWRVSSHGAPHPHRTENTKNFPIAGTAVNEGPELRRPGAVRSLYPQPGRVPPHRARNRLNPESPRPPPRRRHLWSPPFSP